MVATGSGIAPLRGFLQERARLAMMGQEVGPTKLYFLDAGMPRKEISSTRMNWRKSRFRWVTTWKWVTACSGAEKNKNGGKIYVQNRI